MRKFETDRGISAHTSMPASRLVRDLVIAGVALASGILIGHLLGPTVSVGVVASAVSKASSRMSSDERSTPEDETQEPEVMYYNPPDLSTMSPFEYESWASVPYELKRSFVLAGLAKTHVFAYNVVNPFFLCGDFDGDSVSDFAAYLRPIGATGAESATIGVLFGDGKVSWLDKDLSHLENGYPGPAWVLHPKEEGVIDRSDLTDDPVPTLKGDAILAIKAESASALIFWTGDSFDAYWQSD